MIKAGINSIKHILENRRSLGILIIVSAFTVSLILLILIFRPLVIQDLKLVEIEKDKLTEYQILTETLDNLKAVNLEREKERLLDIARLIPSDNDALNALLLIELLAKKNNVELLTSRIGSNSSQEDSNLTGFTLLASLTGEYSNLKSFLTEVYHLKRLIGVSSLNIAGNGLEPKLGLTLELFFPLMVRAEKHVSYPVGGFNQEEEKLISEIVGRLQLPLATSSAVFGRPNPFLPL